MPYNPRMRPPGFDLRVLDLDGSVPPQGCLRDGELAPPIDLRAWGPRVRMACGLRTYRAFANEISTRLAGDRPKLVLYGSGDFHHVTLALLQRLTEPFHLLVLDKHPDWVRGIPFLHCGTWLARALRLPTLGRVFHIGGDLDFDNHYAPFAPWRELRSGRVRVIPARRRFRGYGWGRVPHDCLFPAAGESLADRLDRLLDADRHDLAARPLYVTIDKDVLRADDAAVNWDSGYLSLDQLLTVLDAFGRAAGGRFTGADLLGDWSPVRTAGWPRHVLDFTEHPPLGIRPADAAERNRGANRAIIARLDALVGLVTPPPASPSLAAPATSLHG
jgi:hypothetical protein